MTPLDSFSLDYLRLVLEIHAHHIEGFVDAYYGPQTIQAEVQAAEPLRAPELLAAVHDLQSRIPTADPMREAYLQAALRGIECTIRMLNGETFDYLDEVYQIYDVRPVMTDESQFHEAHLQLDTLLPEGKSGDTLGMRLQAWRKAFEIRAEDGLSLLEMARAETRRRTAGLIELPENDSVELKLVKGQPWSAYNWYLGDGRSLIEFSTDIPLQAPALIGTFAHEGYPGHHTEHMLKERTLYRERGYAEQAAMLLHSPAAVIAEGIATTAIEMIFPNGSHHDWNVEVLFPAAGLHGDTGLAERMRRIDGAVRPLRSVNGNAAILYHTGQINKEQAVDYMVTYGLSTPARAEKSFSFLSHPLYRSYIFTYSVGYDLIAGMDNPKATFMRLLTSQILPSRLIQHPSSSG